ncbi:MAG: neutral/alkaline non-lysosomal ceramidase N-terminal domain-containing protein [Pirellulales bacterium]
MMRDWLVRKHIGIFTVAAFVVGCGAGQASAAELRAGVARIDITPPLSLKPPLGGYGARLNRPAQGVHDRIFAKALILTDGRRKFALITADMLGFALPFKPDFLKQIADQGWSAENVMLLPSHSHTSVEMNALNPRNDVNIPQIGIHDPALYEFELQKFAELVRQAEQKLEPVSIGSSSRRVEGWNRNRREEGGIVDDELTVTRVDTTAGKPLAVLVNFTAHPTFMSEHEMLFSGDWPGALQRTLEAALGQGITAMYYNGAEGDQSPVARRDSGDSPWERSARFGLELGIVAADLWKTTPTARDVAFGFHLQELKLPKRRWHPEFMATGGKEYGLSENTADALLARLWPSETTSGALRLGDLVIVGIPGEMAAALGLRTKAEVRAALHVEHAVIGGIANEWISYILSAESYLQGSGYEASMSFYGPELGDCIVKGAVKGASELTASEPQAVQP